MRGKLGLVLIGVIFIALGASVASTSDNGGVLNFALALGAAGVACCVAARVL